MFGDTANNTRYCCKCNRTTKFYRVKGRKCFECGDCGYQVYPLASTIFRKMRIPLNDLFYVLYKFAITKRGMSAMDIQDELDCSYKTALYFGHKMRTLTQETLEMFEGINETDETLIGGKGKRGGVKGKSDTRIPVHGIRNRETGLVKARVINSISKTEIIPIIKISVRAGAEVHSDELPVYKSLPPEGYIHKYITHKKQKLPDGTVTKRIFMKDGVTTNGIEAFWSKIKWTISGTHVSVSPKHLQKYVDERVFRQNWRSKERRGERLDELLSRLVSGVGTVPKSPQ